MFFNNISSRLINLLQSCHRGSGGQRWGGGRELSWKHEGFQREFAGQTWGQKNEWSQMSSCDLIRFSITVSFNHSKRREVMKEWWMVGVMKRWRDLGKKGLGVVAGLGLCVKCNEPSERASGCFPHFKVISHQILLTRLVGEKHTNTHGLCGIHVHYSNQHKLWLQSGFSGSFNNGCDPLKNNNIKTQIKINCITYCFCVLFQLVLPNSSVWYAPQILLLFLWRDEWHEEKEKNASVANIHCQHCLCVSARAYPFSTGLSHVLGKPLPLHSLHARNPLCFISFHPELSVALFRFWDMSPKGF